MQEGIRNLIRPLPKKRGKSQLRDGFIKLCMEALLMEGFEVHKKEVHCFPLVENLNQLIGNKERELCSKISWKVRTKMVGAKGDQICYEFTILKPAKSAVRPIA